MRKALVSPNEPVHSGYRVADVVDVAFSVAAPLFWVDCEDHIQPDVHFYDVESAQILPAPDIAQSNADDSIRFA